MGDEEVTTLSASEAEYGTWMTTLSPALDSCVDHTVDTTQENLPAAHTSQSKGRSQEYKHSVKMFKNVTTKFVETTWEIVVLSSAPIRATTIYSMGTVHKSVKAQQRERERENFITRFQIIQIQVSGIQLNFLFLL